MKKNNQGGIGLIEILIAVAMLGGLVLLVSQLNQNANKVATNLEINSDVLQTLQQIQGVLAVTDNCKTTFQGRNAANSPSVVQSIKQKIAAGYADVYPTIMSNPTKTYGHKRLKINSYSLSDAGPEVNVLSHSSTHLVITFNRGKNGIQTEIITKKIPLNVRVDASGNIVSCSALSGSKSDIWKYAANNSDIYYASGNVAIGTNSPTSNLTVKATSFPTASSGISIIGSEAVSAGSNRANITFNDQTSTEFWSMSIFGSAAIEGMGDFGFRGGPSAGTGINKFLITKSGDVGINVSSPSCGFPPCNSGRYLHVHSNRTGIYEASQLVMTSEATAPNSLVGGIAFAASKVASADRRVAVITGHTSSPPGAPLQGTLAFWTNNNGFNDIKMHMDPVGNVHTQGTATTDQVIISPSDRRLKKNIRPLQNSLEKILQLRGVSFFWKNTNHPEKNLGLIAQEVEKVFPEVVRTNKDGFKALAYTNLIAPVIDSIKSLVSIDLLQNEEMNKLHIENQMLKTYICQNDPKAKFCPAI